jgi:hypothetical protein
MPPSPAAHLDMESRKYIGELLLARAIVIIRALTPKKKLPDGAYDIDDPYLLTDFVQLVNEFARLDIANLVGKRGRKPAPGKAVQKPPRAQGRPSYSLQDDMFMQRWERTKSGLESQGKRASLADIGMELARSQFQHEDLTRGQGPSAGSLRKRGKENVGSYQKVRARMRKRKHRRDKTPRNKKLI